MRHVTSYENRIHIEFCGAFFVFKKEQSTGPRVHESSPCFVLSRRINKTEHTEYIIKPFFLSGGNARQCGMVHSTKKIIRKSNSFPVLRCFFRIFVKLKKHSPRVHGSTSPQVQSLFCTMPFGITPRRSSLLHTGKRVSGIDAAYVSKASVFKCPQ